MTAPASLSTCLLPPPSLLLPHCRFHISQKHGPERRLTPAAWPPTSRSDGPPTGPRPDLEGGLYYVIARGVERRATFRADADRESFPRPLAAGSTRGERQGLIPFSCAESNSEG